MAAPRNLTSPAPIAEPYGRLEELIQYIRHGEKSLLAGQSRINLIALPLIAAVAATFAIVTIGRIIGATATTAARKYALLGGYCVAVALIAGPAAAVRRVLSAWQALSAQEKWSKKHIENRLNDDAFDSVRNVVRKAPEKDFDGLPTLQLYRKSTVYDLHRYQDGAPPAQYGCLSAITDSVMKGVDGIGQPFIAIKTVCTLDLNDSSKRESCITVFFASPQRRFELLVASHASSSSPWDSSDLDSSGKKGGTNEDLEKLKSLLKGTLEGYRLA